MAIIQTILAKVLIQVGADEPREIGTVEIPIQISTPERSQGAAEAPEWDGIVRTGGAYR